MTGDESRTNFDCIVERELLLINEQTGQRQLVTVKIGRPYWVDEHTEAACAVVIDGLLARREDIRGIDPLNALELAISFVNTYLTGQTGPEKVCWPDGEPYGD